MYFIYKRINIETEDNPNGLKKVVKSELEPVMMLDENEYKELIDKHFASEKFIAIDPMCYPDSRPYYYIVKFDNDLNYINVVNIIYGEDYYIDCAAGNDKADVEWYLVFHENYKDILKDQFGDMI